MLTHTDQNIPEGWRETTLGEVSVKISDGTHGTVIDTEDGDYFLLSCKNIKDGNVVFSNNERRIDEKTLLFLRERTKLEKNDVLITSVGTIGEVAFVREDYPNYEFQRSVAILKPNSNVVLPRFLFYSLFGRKRYLEQNAEGAVQQCLFLGRIKGLEIFLPPLPEQRAIADILSSFDMKIELLREQNETLERTAQMIFHEWFGRYSVENPEKLPEGWRVGKLEEVIEFINGYAFKSSDLLDEDIGRCFKIFKMGNIKKGGGFAPQKTKSYIEVEKCKNLEKYILRNGDLLMSMTDMKDAISLLGHTALMTVDTEYIVNQRVGLLRVKNNFNIDYPYLYLLTNSEDFIGDLRGRSNSGVQVNLSTEAIKSSNIIIADEKTNRRFNDAVKSIFEKIRLSEQEIEILAKTRDELLPRLMSGEIRI